MKVILNEAEVQTILLESVNAKLGTALNKMEADCVYGQIRNVELSYEQPCDEEGTSL